MKELILDRISDIANDFLYYDRKEDSLSVDMLNAAVKSGEITIDEMVAQFRKHLEDTFDTIK